MKKNVVLFGAYDRYNYGDNLMPIVFHDYVKKYHIEKYNEINFIFGSITNSDLTKYHSPRTVAIKDIYKKLKESDTIVCVGGEIFCAPNSTLFLHMPRSKLLNDFMTYMNNLPVARKVIQLLARVFNPIPWDYPYLIDKSKLSAGVKVVYNTAGGSLNGLRPNKRRQLATRLSSCDYLSVRDTRTKENLKSIDDVVLAPDSVHIISELYDDSFIDTKASEDLKDKLSEDYICFQAAPAKVDTDFNELVNSIQTLSNNNNQKVVLLPIGYASGHDDYYLLEKIHKYLPECTELLYDLSLWDILYVIKNSNLYIGTSLHGAITALSFSVPHFGLNKGIYKLNGFLDDWSVSPYNKCYTMSEIVKICSDVKSLPRNELAVISKENNRKIRANFDNIIKVIG